MASSYNLGDLEIFYAGGEGSPLGSATGGPVNIEDIRAKYNKDNLFEDPDFPAVAESIGIIGGDSAAIAQGKPPLNYSWQRPVDLWRLMSREVPQFGFAAAQEGQDSTAACSEYDVMQGTIGDCWYMAALQALCKRPDQVKVVIPEDNNVGFLPENYCGAFHFRFFNPYEEKWVDVVIDDRLPCFEVEFRDRPPGAPRMYRPAFANITAKPGQKIAEFWIALIEKAYAKFIGSYAKIEGGWSSQALVNFTGGFSEIIHLHEKPGDFGIDVLKEVKPYDMFKQKIAGSIKAGFFVGLDTFKPEVLTDKDILVGYTCYQFPPYKFAWKLEESGETKVVVADTTKNGLGLTGPHAYTVLDAQEVKTKDGEKTYFLLKLRNPHARSEWLGKFTDTDDATWGLMEKDLRVKDAKTGSTNIDEGVFWMDLEEAIKYFDLLEICMLGMEHTKLCRIKGELPAEYQTIKRDPATLYDDMSRLSPAYLFDIKQGAQAQKLRGALGTKGVACISVVSGVYYSGMEPYSPYIQYFLAKIPESDIDLPVDLKRMNEYPGAHASSYSIGRESTKVEITEEGTYLLLVSMRPDAVPKELVGKPIPFAIRLFTENETELREKRSEE